MTKLFDRIAGLKLDIRGMEVLCKNEGDFKALRENKQPVVPVKDLGTEQVDVVPIYDGEEVIGCAHPVNWYPGGLSTARVDDFGKPIYMEPYALLNAYLPKEFDGHVALVEGKLTVSKPVKAMDHPPTDPRPVVDPLEYDLGGKEDVSHPPIG